MLDRARSGASIDVYCGPASSILITQTELKKSEVVKLWASIAQSVLTTELYGWWFQNRHLQEIQIHQKSVSKARKLEKSILASTGLIQICHATTETAMICCSASNNWLGTGLTLQTDRTQRAASNSTTLKSVRFFLTALDWYRPYGSQIDCFSSEAHIFVPGSVSGLY